jgi:hypothetical protein
MVYYITIGTLTARLAGINIAYGFTTRRTVFNEATQPMADKVVENTQVMI